MKLNLCRYSIFYIVILGLMVAFGSFSRLLAAEENSSINLTNGVVVDTAQGSVYIMSPKDGIDAVDIATGETRWNSKEAAKPLLVSGNRLVAQAREKSPKSNKLELVVLDIAAKGKRLSSSELELPNGVRAIVDEQLGIKFDVLASQKNDEIFISWKFTFNPIMLRGARLDDDVEKKLAIQTENGTFKLDAATGKTTKVNQSNIKFPESAKTIELKNKTRLANISGRQFLSIDEKTILNSERIANDSKWLKYRWQLYDRNTGKLLGKFEHFSAYAPFSVFNSIIVYETQPFLLRSGKEVINEERKVHALNLQNGQELWSWLVRDTKYRGPFPP